MPFLVILLLRRCVYISAIQAEVLQKRFYTVAEWEKLPEYPRHELIDGELTMQAQPSIDHIEINVELGRQFSNYLLGKSCRVFHDAAVYLRETDQTIFAPDLSVVCDPKKIKKNYVLGAPDLIIEILSRSTAPLDKKLKFTRYQQAGVREYWIVDPWHQFVDVYHWENGPTQPQNYTRTDKIRVSVLDDCVIDLSLVFPVLEDEEIPYIEN